MSFIDQSTVPGADIVGWHWEFEDGAESSQQHPTHTYAADGTYGGTEPDFDDAGEKLFEGSGSNDPTGTISARDCA